MVNSSIMRSVFLVEDLYCIDRDLWRISLHDYFIFNSDVSIVCACRFEWEVKSYIWMTN